MGMSGVDEVFGEADRVSCTSCGLEIYENEAQAQRWGYWRIGSGVELYPFCPDCATRVAEGWHGRPSIDVD